MQKTTYALALLFAGLTAGCDKPDRTGYFDSSRIYLYGSQKDYNNPEHMPTSDLPEKRIVDTYTELTSRQLLNHKLRISPERVPWASTFFPTWFGGVAGRWQDNKLLLVFRSLWGTTVLSDFSAEELLIKAQAGDARAEREAYRLSPTEKYDYALGDYTARATRAEAVVRGHNTPQMVGVLPFWMGYCNGVAIAATRYAEPFREVEVRNPDGYRVRFHPNDIKGLLSLAHSHASMTHWQVGSRCDEYSTSKLACNDINPASLVLVLANRIGLAHEPIIVDQNPLAPVINNPVSSATITVLQPPYPVKNEPGIAALMVVRIDLEVASTLLSTDAANVRDVGLGVFKRVEGGKVPLTYEALIALDSNQRLIGGRWSGRKMSGPDFVWGTRRSAPDDIAAWDHLDANAYLRYSVLRALHAKSISTERELPTLDITSIIPNSETDLFSYYTKGIERLNTGRTIRVLGRLGEKYAHLADHVSCWAGPDKAERPEDVAVVNFQFKKLSRQSKFLEFDLAAAVNRKGPNHLKCYFYGPGPDSQLVRLTQASTIIIYP